MRELDLFPKQTLAWDALIKSDKGEIMYGGGARGGKSFLGSLWVIHQCLTMPGSAWLVARERFSDLRDTTLKTWHEIITMMGISDKVNYNAQSHVATFSNGSVIFFREVKYLPSDPEFDRLGSLDLTGVFLDEAQQINRKAVDVLRGRLSKTVSKKQGWQTVPKMFFTCNPGKGWIYRDFYKPFKDGTLADWRVFIRSLATDNPHVPTSYIDQLRRSDKITVERLLYGNFDYDNDEDALMDRDMILDLFENDHVKPGVKRYITADIATRGSDKFVIAVWQGLVLTHVYEVAKCDGKEVVDLLRKIKIKHRVPNRQLIFDADGVGGGITGFFKRAKEFKNGSAPEGKANYENLKTQCYYKLAQKVNESAIYISADISEGQKDSIVEELESIKQRDADKDGKLKLKRKEDIKQDLGRSPDYADAIMMRMYVEVQTRIAAPV